MLVTAATNLRPELFRVVLAEVPFVDVVNTMLDATLPLTVIEYDEWGDPNEPEAYAYIRSYSPYDNIEARDYPHMLVTAGLNDPRVAYWEPAKYTAKLRAKRTDSNRLLLRINMGAGHGGASGRYDFLREVAFKYAFVLDVLGMGEGEAMPDSSQLPAPNSQLPASYQKGDRGHRLANSRSTPKVRPAAPTSSASEMAANAASLLDGVQNQFPFASM